MSSTLPQPLSIDLGLNPFICLHFDNPNGLLLIRYESSTSNSIGMLEGPTETEETNRFKVDIANGNLQRKCLDIEQNVNSSQKACSSFYTSAFNKSRPLLSKCLDLTDIRNACITLLGGEEYNRLPETKDAALNAFIVRLQQMEKVGSFFEYLRKDGRANLVSEIQKATYESED
jgi:hypothetical protein